MAEQLLLCCQGAFWGDFIKGTHSDKWLRENAQTGVSHVSSSITHHLHQLAVFSIWANNITNIEPVLAIAFKKYFCKMSIFFMLKLSLESMH